MDPAEQLLYDIFSNTHERGKMLQTEKYARVPFVVDAVQVTADNMEDVAQWCQGEVRSTGEPEGVKGAQYVKVRVHRPLTDRQTMAYVGDWILYAGTGYKVYTSKAFEKSFEPASGVLVDSTTQAAKPQPTIGVSSSQA